jgi:hypothetical protein
VPGTSGVASPPAVIRYWPITTAGVGCGPRQRGPIPGSVNPSGPSLTNARWWTSFRTCELLEPTRFGTTTPLGDGPADDDVLETPLDARDPPGVPPGLAGPCELCGVDEFESPAAAVPPTAPFEPALPVNAALARVPPTADFGGGVVDAELACATITAATASRARTVSDPSRARALHRTSTDMDGSHRTFDWCLRSHNRRRVRTPRPADLPDEMPVTAWNWTRPGPTLRRHVRRTPLRLCSTSRRTSGGHSDVFRSKYRLGIHPPVMSRRQMSGLSEVPQAGWREPPPRVRVCGRAVKSSPLQAPTPGAT